MTLSLTAWKLMKALWWWSWKTQCIAWRYSCYTPLNGQRAWRFTAGYFPFKLDPIKAAHCRTTTGDYSPWTHSHYLRINWQDEFIDELSTAFDRLPRQLICWFYTAWATTTLSTGSSCFVMMSFGDFCSVFVFPFLSSFCGPATISTILTTNDLMYETLRHWHE